MQKDIVWFDEEANSYRQSEGNGNKQNQVSLLSNVFHAFVLKLWSIIVKENKATQSARYYYLHALQNCIVKSITQ